MAHRRKKPGPKKRTTAHPPATGPAHHGEAALVTLGLTFISSDDDQMPVNNGQTASTSTPSEAESSTRAVADSQPGPSQEQLRVGQGGQSMTAEKPIITYMKKGRKGQSIAATDAAAVERARLAILSAMEDEEVPAGSVTASGSKPVRPLPLRSSQRQAAQRQSSTQAAICHEPPASGPSDIATPHAPSPAEASSSLRIVIPPATRRPSPLIHSPQEESLPPTPVEEDAEHIARHETARALAALQEEYARKAAALRSSQVPSEEIADGASPVGGAFYDDASSAHATQATSPPHYPPVDEPMDPIDPPVENAPPDYDPFSHPYFDDETYEEFWEADADGDHFYRFQANGGGYTYCGEAPDLTGRAWSEVEHFTIFHGPNDSEYRRIPGGYRVPRFSISQRRHARIEWVRRHGFPNLTREDEDDSGSDYEEAQSLLQQQGKRTDADLEADTDTDNTPGRALRPGTKVPPAADIDTQSGAASSSNANAIDKGKGRAQPAIPLPRSSSSNTQPSAASSSIANTIDKGKGRAEPATPFPHSSSSNTQPTDTSGSIANTIDKGKGRAKPAIPFPRASSSNTQPTAASSSIANTIDKGKGRAEPAIPLPHLAANTVPDTTTTDTISASAPLPSLPFIHPATTFKTTKPTIAEMTRAREFGTQVLGTINAFANDLQRAPELVMSMAGLPLSLDERVNSGWNNFQQVYSHMTPGVPRDSVWYGKCLALYKNQVQSLPSDERRVAEAAIEAQVIALASNPAVAKSPSARMDIVISELEKRSHAERLSSDIVIFHFPIYIGDDDGARHKNCIVASHPLARNILERSPYATKKIVNILTDCSRMELIDQDYRDAITASSSSIPAAQTGDTSGSSATQTVNGETSGAATKEVEMSVEAVRRILSSSNSADRHRKAVVTHWLAQLRALTGLYRGNFPSSRFGVVALTYHIKMVNFPDDDRLKPLCPGCNDSKKAQPAFFWQKLADLYLHPTMEPPRLEAWSEEDESHVIHSDEWNAIALVTTTSGEPLLTAGVAHRSRFRSSNADVPSDEEDSGEIHYIPPEEFNDYEIVDKDLPGPSRVNVMFSESPEIRVTRKRALEDIVEYEDEHEDRSEIGDFSQDDITPRPSRPVPVRSYHVRRASSVPPPQPNFAPTAESSRRHDGQSQDTQVKRRRVVLTEDEAYAAQRRLEVVAARGQHVPAAATRQPSRGPSQPPPAASPLPSYTIEDHSRQSSSRAIRHHDIPSTLTPELFEEARRKKAKQALLDQQRSAVGLNASSSRRQHVVQSVASGSQQSRGQLLSTVAPQQPRVYPLLASGSHSRQAVHPAASVDVFYSPTKALPPSTRRLSNAMPPVKPITQRRQEPVAGPSSTIRRTNGTIKGKYPPLM